MTKVRFVMIGVGGMGRSHIGKLLQVPEAEIVALADPSPGSIEAARSRFPELANTPAFSDYRQALAEVEADAAVIVTLHSQHFEQGMACIDAGLHVLMEKPFVAGSHNAEKFIAYANEKGKHVAVAYQRHLMGTYRYLRDLVQDGELGQIRFIVAYQCQAWQKATVGTWRQDPELSCGGQLNDSGSHLLDVVLWITGLEPEEVSASIDNRGSRVDIDTAMTVRFRGGALATFNVVGSATTDMIEDITIHGDKGAAFLRNGKVMVAKEGQKTPVEVPTNELPNLGNPDSNFVDLILGRVEQAAAPAECGAKIARLTEAAWKSAEQDGARIRL